MIHRKFLFYFTMSYRRIAIDYRVGIFNNTKECYSIGSYNMKYKIREGRA